MPPPLCHRGTYAASVARLVSQLQLPMPSYVLAPDGSSTPAPVDLPLRSSSMYLCDEYSDEWKYYLKALEPTKRHHASCMRRATTAVYLAIRFQTCLYCWLPCANCMCEVLWREHLKVAAASAKEDLSSSATVILHVNELLRTTNTGHIACFLLDGPLRVWGLDDEWLDRLRPTEELPADDRGDPRVRLNVLLYPEEGCNMLTDFVPSALTARAASSSVEMHYMLSDGTWGQAHRVNRHVPRDIPRVALTIPEEYEPLFAALRRQTRSTGVSTLEAVMLAVEAQGAAAKAAHTHAAQAEQASSAVLTCFTATMKRFVDTVLVLKNANAVFADAHDDEFLADAAEKRNRNKTLRQVEERAARERELGPAAVQALMAPPVVSFCYVCDTYIGWSRMPEHVTGARHRELLLVNPAGMPSERSRDVTCDYHLLRVMPKGPS